MKECHGWYRCLVCTGLRDLVIIVLELVTTTIANTSISTFVHSRIKTNYKTIKDINFMDKQYCKVFAITFSHIYNLYHNGIENNLNPGEVSVG